MCDIHDEKADIAYGCVFCITGKEQALAEQIQSLCPSVSAITMRRMKYRTYKGSKYREEAVVLPGYVFFSAPTEIKPSDCFPKQDIIRILTSEKWHWQLMGEDEEFARWLFTYDGLLDFSKAYREGERIRILSGPLKDLEGKITRIDKRGCSGQVILNFNGRSIPVWLGFEMVSPIEI